MRARPACLMVRTASADRFDKALDVLAASYQSFILLANPGQTDATAAAGSVLK
jgi:hypothetical protein